VKIKTRSTKVVVDGVGSFYATPTGVKSGPRSKVYPAAVLVSLYNKGTARRIRKALRNAGYASHAAAPRATL
jgi:hypothetical protein